MKLSFKAPLMLFGILKFDYLIRTTRGQQKQTHSAQTCAFSLSVFGTLGYHDKLSG